MFPLFSSTMFHASSDLLLMPISLFVFSATSHAVLSLFLFVTWACKKIKTRIITVDASEQNSKKTRPLHLKPVILCCLFLSLFNFLLCFLNYFRWSTSDRSHENYIIFLDSVCKAITWLMASAYLHNQSSNSRELRNPLMLRTFWGFNFLLFFYYIAVGVSLHCKNQPLPIEFWVSGFITFLSGFFFCWAEFFPNKAEDSILEAPLLSGDGTPPSTAESGEVDGAKRVASHSKTNFFGVLTFSWVSPLIALGNKKTLDLEDVPELARRDSVEGLFPIFKNKLGMYGGSSEICSFSLVKSLLFIAWKEILLTGLLALVSALSSYVGPYLINYFVQFLNDHNKLKKDGYILASAFLVAKIVECFSQRHWFFRVQLAGLRARAALVAIIYKKGLTLSSQSRQNHTSGEIINFMSVDAERIGMFSWRLHDLWIVPLQVALALLILYKNLGLASISAFAATLLIMLINLPLGKFLRKYQENLMKVKDIRMKATTEILRNMRILKLQGWEMKFLSKIMDIRKTEEGSLRKFVYTLAATLVVFWGAPTFVSVVTFVTCIFMGIPLDTGKVLSALATIGILETPIYKLPDLISSLTQTKVSVDRIASFLRLEDLSLDDVVHLPRGSSEVAVEIVDGNFSWDSSSAVPQLKDLNLRVSSGMKVAVCGTVGSGKSSLLSCILGEIPKVSGSVKLSGTKAYVAQSPWIQSGKIEENILFGREMDREMYEMILDACALRKDLDVLPFHDQTEIGERGINLSGGQKQRIQIARALYQDADLYLLDDPFSALDAHTGTHIFKECLLRLLATKTVIYVTHQIEFLHAADLILVMKDGKITQAGKYHEILHSETDFMELVGAHRQALSALDSIQLSSSSGESHTGDNVIDGESQKDDQKSTQDDVGPKGQLVQEEEREKGKVGFPVYWKYLTTAYRGAFLPVILLGEIFFQFLQIVSNYWMAWATPATVNTEPPVPAFTLLYVYVILAVACSCCILLRDTVLVTVGYKTATILFNKMHHCIFRAPMSFFDSTPSGRILNRASTDQSAVDLSIPYQIASFAYAMIQLIGVVVFMSHVAWQVFIVFIPVIAACIWYQQYYLPSARELSRLIGVSKAPLIQHFSESISGSTTIRGFNQESRFQDRNMELIDKYSRPKFYNSGAMQWLCFRLDLLSSVTFGFSLFLLVFLPEGFIDPSIAGLAVTYGLTLNSLQEWAVWALCDVENRIISVERIFQYSLLESEPPLVCEANRPDTKWPSQGEVQFHDLQVRYAPQLPLVLRGLTCTLVGGMKTGIVGRTGSGKSTLIQTLFRIVDPVAGYIRIDGNDISSIGLHDLRSRLSIIPQDPTMFDGTIRSNLDPLEEYTDEQIWEALDLCQLGDEVRRKEGKLDAAVTENGENWSMGQRQLVCLGRVLLKKSKVLVLDEATASVDTATDNLIQQTIRQHFSDSTVITIAHRITSVLDSDMILLLENGLIAEHDTPTRLLENKSSLFAKLVADYAARSNQN
ncbi:ABC transporter-like, ATP-binding domain [Dillenia turbinata]|uniref:ABC-type xenobiotic transporter n=1 Tax=Dillenia turbinata TaxID=194707 RepID=A0AAN8VHZ5_9MAGN